jgi:glucosamine--fructose-6-phosphate aminotransferase (isomerizing)
VAELAQVSAEQQRHGTGIAITTIPHAPAVHNAHRTSATAMATLQKPVASPWCTTASPKVHEELRRALQAKVMFSSQTDTEVIVHLVDSLYDGDDVRGAGGCGVATAWRIRHCCLLAMSRTRRHAGRR